MKWPRISVGNWQMPGWVQVLYGHMSQIERLVFAWLVLLLVISGFWSIVAFVNRHTELLPEAGGLYREAAVGQPRHLNSILASANDIDVDISSLVYSSLFQLDENLQIQNDLATGYELSSDNTVYTVTLRSDVAWHDGAPFTADDVVFTIRSIQTPDYGSPLESAFQGVTVEKIDDYTVQFKLTQSYAPFLTSLTVGIVPEHVWESIAPSNAALAEQILKPVGTGPFQFKELKTRRKTGDITVFRIIRNERYYGQRPYLDEVEFDFFPTHEDAVQALIAGNVDGVGFLPLQLLDDVVTRSALSVHRLLLPQYFGMFFNQNQNTILSDAGVRNALELALNRQKIVEEALSGQGEVLHLPIPPGVFAFNEELEPPKFDPEAARQNLEEAGWKDEDGDGIREKNDVRLHLKIATTDWPEYVRTAEVVQKQWLEIGVETEIKHFGAGTIQQTVIRPRDYQILLFGEILSPEPDPYPFWHSTQTRSPGLNFALFKNKEVDELLEKARKTVDTEERRQLYKEFQGKIIDLKPAIILYRPYYLFASKAKIRGIVAHHAAKPGDRFNFVEQWHVNVRRVWNSN